MKLTAKQLLCQFNHILVTRFRWISFSVVAIIVLTGTFFFLYPKFSEIRKVGVFDLQRTQNQLELKQQIFATTKELAGVYDVLNQQDVKKLEAMLPKKQDIPNMFVQVEAIAESSGMKLQSVGFTDLGAANQTGRAAAAAPSDEETTAKNTNATPPTQTAPTTSEPRNILRKMGVTFSVSGENGYADLKGFLTNVESSVRMLDIQSFSYTTDSQGQYQINAITYYLQQ